jgi:hypothetical protein
MKLTTKEQKVLWCALNAAQAQKYTVQTQRLRRRLIDKSIGIKNDKKILAMLDDWDKKTVLQYNILSKLKKELCKDIEIQE